MDKCQYYKGTDKIDAETTRILCSYMTSGGKTFKNKDPEGAALIQCCWHKEKKCPIMDEDLAGSILDKPDSASEKEEEQPMEQGQQTFTTEVAASNDTKVSSERQKKALELTSRITARYEIVRQYLLEIARDLTVVKEEKLFVEMGVKDFDEYCDQIAGFGSRQGYNFIKIYKRFGEEKLSVLQHLGSTKLTDMADLDTQDFEDLMSKYDVEVLSTRELRRAVNEYKNKYEQLTLLLDEEKSKNSENASLESQVEELKQFAATLNDNYNKALKEKAEAIKEHQSEMKKLTADRDKQINELKKKQTDYEELEQRYKEIASRPAEISEEERAALIRQGRDEMCKEKDESWGAAVELARKTATRNTEKKFTEEIDSLKILNSELRKIADSDKEKYKNELEKLKAENAALQSNAQNSPAPAPMSGTRDKVKFYFKQIESAFTAATETVSEADAEERTELTTALKKALERMSAALEQTE